MLSSTESTATVEPNRLLTVSNCTNGRIAGSVQGANAAEDAAAADDAMGDAVSLAPSPSLPNGLSSAMVQHASRAGRRAQHRSFNETTPWPSIHRRTTSSMLPLPAVSGAGCAP